MKPIYYQLFCWAYISMGVIHELIVISQFFSVPPEHISKILAEMKAVQIFNSSLYHFFVGYDFLVGMFFFAYGYLAKTILDIAPKYALTKGSFFIILFSINLIGCILATTFFFFLPIIFTAFAFCAHSYSYIINRGDSNEMV